MKKTSKLVCLSLVISAAISILVSSAHAAPPPWQYHRILGYDAAADIQTQSPARKTVAELVTKYNARFGPQYEDYVDKSNAASNAFVAFQNQAIASLQAAGRIQPLFYVDMKAANERLSFFTVTDENTDLVAIYFSRGNLAKREIKSQSILYVRPIASIKYGQVIQDANDVTGFYIESPQGLDTRTGGAASLRYVTNVSYFKNKKYTLAQRIFGDEPFKIVKVNGAWTAQNSAGTLAGFKADGGGTSFVTVKAINK